MTECGCCRPPAGTSAAGGKLWLNGFVRCPQDNPAIRPEDLLCVQDYEQAGYAMEDALEHTDAREHRYLRLILTPIQSKK